MFRVRTSRLWPSSNASGLVTSVAIALTVIIIPIAIALRYLSLNQALILSLALAYATLHRYLSGPLVFGLAFATALFFIPAPSRQMFGVDLLPLVSMALIFLAVNKDNATEQMTGLNKRNYSKLYFVGAIAFAVIAILSSLLNFRSLDFIPWAVFPIASGIAIKAFQRSSSLKFRDLAEYWIVGAALLMLIDFTGLFTARYRSTDIFNYGRFVGSLGDYELSAEIYGLTILFSIYVLLVTEKKWMRALALLEISGFGALLLSTQTRSSFLLTLAGGIVMIFTSAVSKRLKRSIVTGALIAVSAAAVLLAGGSFQEIWNRITAIELNQEIASVANRAGVWSYFQQLKSFADLPPIGNGFSYPYEKIQSYPHSLFLWILWSGGFFATLIFAVLIFASLASAFSRWREFRVDASAALIILSFVFIDQAKVEVARFASTTWIFWLILAMTFATFESRKVNLREEKESLN